MAQGSFVPVSTHTDAQALAFFEAVLEAIATVNSGATEPSETWPFMLWMDTSAGYIKQRSADNTTWSRLGPEILDEDDLASDSDTGVPTQQSVKAYVDGVSLGVGQVWADVTGSRAINTIYTNNTGRMIFVAVTGTAASFTNRDLGLRIDGNTIIRSTASLNTDGSVIGSVALPVPDQSTYEIVDTGGAVTITSWWEFS